MANVKKISEEQFVLDCINKEYELCGVDKRFDSFQELREYSKQNPGWFDEYEFSDEGTYRIWIEYIKAHTYDWLPKKTSKTRVESNASLFSLNYGFPCRYSKNETGK